MTTDDGNLCAFECGREAVVMSDDGVWSCHECATMVVEAMSKYALENAEAAGFHVGPNRAQRRALKRQGRLRNNGKAWQG